jgi:NTP pyrophosphatase (non-canonical NTP hydrolase)
MQIVFDKIRELIAAKAVHRKGFVMGEIEPLVTAGHTVTEAAELMQAVAFKHPRQAVLDEMADTVCCVCHLAIALGIAEEEIAEAAVRKLALRITVPGVPCGT